MRQQLPCRLWHDSRCSSPALPGQPSRLDLWFWGVAALGEVRKSRLFTLTELKAVVEAFAEIVDLEEMKSVAKST